MNAISFFLTAFILMFVAASVFAAERETYYSNLICEQEYKGASGQLPSGLRPDCITSFAIIEFDWAKSPKHYECMGQALIYALETNLTPVCVLLARTDEELEFGNSLEFSRFNIVLKVIDTRQWDRSKL